MLDLITGSALLTEGGTIKENKMQIKIIEQTVADKKARKVGEILTVSDKEALHLISLNRAVKHEEAAAEIKVPAEPSDEDKAEVAAANKEASNSEIADSKQQSKNKKRKG